MIHKGHFKVGDDPRRRKYPPLETRFWNKVRKTPDCWDWIAAKRGKYGIFSFHGKLTGAHRVAWILTTGTIPDGLFICHHCDNPSCVNPGHLFIGTARDNTYDARKKGRLGAPAKTHCMYGHPYEGDNIGYRKSYKPGRESYMYRFCKICWKAQYTYDNRKRGGKPIPAHWSMLIP